MAIPIAEITIDRLVDDYVARNPESRRLFERAQAALPGGNTRTGVYMAPFPFYASRGAGKYLYDVDGHQLLDFVNNNTVLILGHAHPEVVKAIHNAVANGTGFSRPTALEIELAEELQRRMPSLERIRFSNSGTEAVLNAIRAAKAFTGRPQIAKFEGAYHGTSEQAMVSHIPPLGPELGPVEQPNPVHSSAGLGASADEVIVLPFNDINACERILAQQGAEIAAVIVDPLMTGAGLTLPVDGFLTRLREQTTRYGMLLIFDEIISFRIGPGGAQERFHVRPDLTALAKIVAGGMPGGAFGGRADIMALYDPLQGAKIPQAGTFNGNPVTMSAGLATLRELTPSAYDRLEALTNRLADGLREVFSEAGIPASVESIGSLFRVHFLAHAPQNYRESGREDRALQRWLMFWLLNNNVVWNPLANVSLAIDETDVDTLLSLTRSGLRNLPMDA